MKDQTLVMKSVVSAAIFGLLVVACPTAFSQDSQRILRSTENLYASLKGYHFEGLSQMKVEVDGVKYRMNLPLEIAQGETPDQRLSILYKGPSWEKPIGNASKDYPPLAGISMPDSRFYDFASIAQRVKSTKFLRLETLEANGKRTPCFVISVMRNLNRETVTVWIDKNTRLVLRVQFQTIVEAENSQPTHQLNWITTFTSYKLNAGIPDWLAKRKSRWDDQVAALKAKMIGTTAPDFKLPAQNGSEVRLADLRDRIVLLNFWATWCFPCRRELPMIAKIERDWTAKGLTVLRITNETPEDVRAFLKRSRQKFATLVSGETVSRQYKVDGIPTLVLIDRSGKIAAYDVSELSEADLLERLKQAGLETP